MRKMKAWCLGSVIFFAAFLLFQIELIISKVLLFNFGGAYTVWGAALVFFQATLLLGYAYSHFVLTKIGIRRYRYIHFTILFLALLFFPGRGLPQMVLIQKIPMVVNIFLQLARCIGPVFFLLSTTSVIFQAWFSMSGLPERKNPYVLYAVSNLGSFAGLLTYPFFFELFFGLSRQLNMWRIIYFFLLLLHVAVFMLVKPDKNGAADKELSAPIANKEKWHWFLLSIAGVVMFLSVTNIITYEITPMPLLWIMPLCIYLFSFVLSFKKKPWNPPWLKEKFYIIIAYSILLFFIVQQRVIPVAIEIILQLVLLFFLCMFCQTELNSTKPKDSRNLSMFYLMVSSGGFVGGLLVSWVMPLITAYMLDYLVGIFIISLAMAIANQKIFDMDRYRLRLIIYSTIFMLLWPMVFDRYNFIGIVVILIVLKMVYSELKAKPLAVCLNIGAILCLFSLLSFIWAPDVYIYAKRNYYGVYKVYERRGKRMLLNGTTLHGGQYIGAEKRKEPLTYYHHDTPVGEILLSELFEFNDIGLVGLGSGALAAYGSPKRAIDFFELDRDVFYIAKNYFTYLNDSESEINYIFGDARITMRDIPDNKYDLLIIDAFSGDSIPVHLLTVEAIKEYLRCLKDNGLILFHTSNRYMQLEPVLFSNAKELNIYACYKFKDKSDNEDAFASSWIAITSEPDNFQKLISKLGWSHKPEPGSRASVPWTDEYHDLVLVFEIKNLLSQIRNFQPFYWEDRPLTVY
ncbi:MAG: hypothetical protein COV72_04560 [Candidatus Omnitrophica bacterium CG11_big_fil_rev_8_21_14_0_20_42_13]|uniref:PABS domain-containing protein n=1 Tax=Candidatus Ghiorseimicrobium undicola TaxID=1974746 RepID=A0A2H0LXK8_9BACT|nr:MAG: hypothetical protein COV72_04560 [Candidatus Omnitrophica bacterium CG11_big_fil_rev_8_21_14_0_20_42_13]